MLNKKLTYKLIILISTYQIGYSQTYKKDSLQVKAYTEITYKNSIAQSVKLKKVFCDFCNALQLTRFGEGALYMADQEKYFPENKLKDGKKKLAIYIRISKLDFAAIKE